MAYLKSKNDKDEYYSNGYSDEKFELDPAALEAIAGGAGQTDYYDTYRYWRDQNGVLREIR
ncbi:MAG: hypothetical protein IJJ07_07205 [Lachnospiraceae bacterium]|nr:hypothetical protein [Lachnospiraceae bacterium]